jgi:hypothetical protein
MENKFAIFVTYLNHLMNGNLVTDLLSIGGKTSKTGPDPPAPAHAGGLNVHGTFEGKYSNKFEVDEYLPHVLGDAGMTRGDAFFGDNHSFNQTLFDKVKLTKSSLNHQYRLICIISLSISVTVSETVSTT